MDIYTAFTLVGSVVCLFLGLSVVKQNPKKLLNLTLGLGILCLSVMQFGVFMMHSAGPDSSAMFWARIGFAGACFVPPIGVISSLVFFRDNYRAHLRKWKWFLIGMGIVSVGSLALLPTDLLIKEVEHHANGHLIYLGRVGGYFAIYVLLAIVTVLFNTENTFRQANIRDRKEIRFVIFSVVSVSIIYTYITGMALLFHSIDTSLLRSSSIGVVLGCVLSAYSIVRYRLLNSTITVSRDVVYSSLTFLLAGIFLLLMGLLGGFLREISKEYSGLLVAAVVFWAIFLAFTLFTAEGTKRKVRAFINRNLYRYVHDYRKEWMELTRRTSSVIGLDQMLDVVTNFISEAMETPKVSIMLLDESSHRFTVAKSGNSFNTEMAVDQDSPIVKTLWKAKEPLKVETMSAGLLSEVFSSNNQDASLESAIKVLVPLITEEKFIGILVLGKRNSGRKFSGDDFVFLKTTADQSSVAINNAKLSEELSSSRQLESFHKLSSFIIHDLKNSISTLSILADNASNNFADPEFQKDALDAIHGTVAKMKNLTSKLSTMPEELQPSLQACDINGVVKKVISRVMFKGQRNAVVKTDLADLPAIRADQDQLERVVQNLVLNAIEALGGNGEVSITTFVDGNFVNIQVADTGRGMSQKFIKKRLFKPFQTTKKNGLGIGLYQVKAIVDVHGGEIEVKSKQGEGTTFLVKLPK